MTSSTDKADNNYLDKPTAESVAKLILEYAKNKTIEFRDVEITQVDDTLFIEGTSNKESLRIALELLPEKKEQQLAESIDHFYVEGRIDGYNQAIDDIRQAFEDRYSDDR